MTGGRDLATSRQWLIQGTDLFLGALDRTGDDSLSAPTALPGWNRLHLVAHVAANAEALLNLAHWAATGEETPMYPSLEQRDRDIQEGGQRPPEQLRGWVADSAVRLARALDALSDQAWSRPVRTAQGRMVPASEIPWLRAREVMVHAVDLTPALGFSSLPEGFLLALMDDVVTRRSTGEQPALLLSPDDGQQTWEVSGRGGPTKVCGSLPALAAYLVGRSLTGVESPSGPVPNLPRWL